MTIEDTPNKSNEAFIRSILGNDIQTVFHTGEGNRWKGWKMASFDEDHISITQATRAEKQKPSVMKLIEDAWPSCHQANIRLWSNFGVNIFAFPNMPVLEVAQLENVGADRTIFQGNPAKLVHDVLSSIFIEDPFEIIFADSAGLEAVFLKTVSPTKSLKIESKILSIATDSINLMYHELYGNEDLDDNDPRLNTICSDYVQLRQRFRLYWS